MANCGVIRGIFGFAKKLFNSLRNGLKSHMKATFNQLIIRNLLKCKFGNFFPPISLFHNEAMTLAETKALSPRIQWINSIEVTDDALNNFPAAKKKSCKSFSADLIVFSLWAILIEFFSYGFTHLRLTLQLLLNVAGNSTAKILSYLK